MSALFLLTLLHSLSETDAGLQFNECLGNDMYNSLVSFASSIPNKERFCCDNGCSFGCVPMSPDCSLHGCGDPGRSAARSQCNKIGGSKFCVFGVGFYGKQLCGGILGNASSTELQTGNCPSFSAVGNALNIERTTPTFS
jgi:hypothetical protein